MSVRILSFDVGIKNLSYCLMSFEEGVIKVLEWDNISIIEGNAKKLSFDVLSESMLEKLMEKFGDIENINIVLIENQPMLKNGNMKSVAVMIYSYFTMLKLQHGSVNEVKFISAGNKLKCNKVKELMYGNKDTYKDRKKMGIALAGLYIKTICPDKEEWFNRNKKKDDLSDSLLAGIYYCEMNLS